MILRLARAHEVEEVVRLYREALRDPYSVWNEEYPSRQEAVQDQETGNLYVLTL